MWMNILEAEMRRIDTTLETLIALFFEEFVAMYGDEELASVATSAVINELLVGAENELCEDAA